MLLKNYLRILVNHIALRAYVSALYQPTTLPFFVTSAMFFIHYLVSFC